jgi:hypothetical protein
MAPHGNGVDHDPRWTECSPADGEDRDVRRPLRNVSQAAGGRRAGSGARRLLRAVLAPGARQPDRSEAARRPGAPAWALAALAADQSPLVRAEVALRPDLPDEIVATLADPDREPDRTVLRRMAKHPALGAHAPRLAAVDDLVVHRQLAGNPSTPATVLAVLSRHADPAVRQAARARLVGAALDADGRSRLPVGVRNYLAAPIGRHPTRSPRSSG